MRNFTDEHGIVGWIFDEKTHPMGNQNPKNIKNVEPVKKVEPVVAKPVVKLVVKKKK